MRRRRDDHDGPDPIHREILEHLDRNPPPRDREPAPAPRPARKSKPEAATHRPAEPPRLMLRKMRRELALERLSTFVRYHRHRATPRVVVVVGRGRHSGDGGPVIGPAVRQWCDRHPDLVHDVHVAPPSQGGDGALVLHLAAGD
jgi:hypothetical protein